MRTAMQELIHWIGEVENSIGALMATEIELKMLSQFKNKCMTLLEKEQENIMDAWINGKESDSFGYDIFSDAEKYYKTTFKKTS